MKQSQGDPSYLTIVLFSLQEIDQIQSGEEAHAFVVGRDYGYSQGTGQVCVFPVLRPPMNTTFCASSVNAKLDRSLTSRV